ncbi:DGQHR domain-containing protein [Agrobacterium tumefaciens]|uniref:DGQHR domain-containing protein n=1 Tax=Agrobacterium tumefaciens TaxID=358 RepID=UPI001571C4A6|nr:DGQHR domain-containing protein [Agrobacterium tumefaciens]
MTADVIKFAAVKMVQPIGELFVGKIPASALARLAKADIRRITSREMERMSGIQRGLNTGRVAEIKNYIETSDASFPNAFILNLNSAYLKARPLSIDVGCGDEQIYCFEVDVGEGAFSIIDGQHRLSGFQGANVGDFDLIVSFFIDLPVEDQAYLFSTINVTQQKVNKSLVYDLFDVSETRSPQKTAHTLSKALNTDEDSPLYRRIKLLGLAPKFEDEVLYRAPLSQGAVAAKIVELISSNPMADRDIYRRGGTIDPEDKSGNEVLIFRTFFAEDKDWAILKVLKNYFKAVADAFPTLWSSPDNPLAKTIGYGALMRLLVDVYKVGVQRGELSYNFFREIMEEIRKASEIPGQPKIDFDTFAAAGSGESKLYKQLYTWSGIKPVENHA